MSTQSNGDLVRTAFASWEQGDSRPFFQIVADDVTWRVIGSTPVSGTYHSRSEFLGGAAGQLFERFAEPLVAKVTAVHEAGDTVVLQWQGTSRGVNGRPWPTRRWWTWSPTSTPPWSTTCSPTNRGLRPRRLRRLPISVGAPTPPPGYAGLGCAR